MSRQLRTYAEWNACLLQHHLTRGPRRERQVQRIPATPEELAEAVGAGADSPEAVSEALVACVRRLLAPGTNFDTYCTTYRGWRPDSSAPPHFFAMLWFTCLVAYGYPDGKDGFHERLTRIVGRSQSHAMWCLPKLWEDLADWTRQQASRPEPEWRQLILPEPCNYRTNIGYSWFLAFPHRDDRRRLHEVLASADLLAEEPPVHRVLAALDSNAKHFSKYFRQDLKHFRTDFIETDADVRKSPFWRAVRQECLREVEEEDPGEFATLLAVDRDQLLPYVACSDRTTLPAGFSIARLPEPIREYTHLVRLAKSDEVLGMMGATEALLAGDLPWSTSLARQVRRGVLVFRHLFMGEFEISSGSEADGADRALVRQDKVEAFRAAFGGYLRPCLGDWFEIYDCRVRIRPEPFPGLEDVIHLQLTQATPQVHMVGGIRAAGNYYALPGFLPRIRYSAAVRVEVFGNSSDEPLVLGQHDPETDEWNLPNGLVQYAPGSFRIVVTYSSATGSTRRVETEFALVRHQLDIHYKTLPQGRYELESECEGGRWVIEHDSEIPTALERWDSPDCAPGPSTNSTWRGVAAAARALDLRNALSAMAAGTGTIRYGEVLEMQRVLIRTEEGQHDILHDMIRSWVELGSFDVVRRMAWRLTLLAPRRPGFVAVSRADCVEATLLGLVPITIEERLITSAERLGANARHVTGPGRLVPGVLRVRCSDDGILKELANEYGLVPTRHVPWPSHRHGPRTWPLREDPIPEQYRVACYYDLDTGGRRSQPPPEGGVRVLRREHPQHPIAYEVREDDESWGWTRWRHVALLIARELRDGSLPYRLDGDGVLRREDAGVPWLPLWIGRACTVYGAGPPGPTSGWSRGYAYPLGDDLRAAIGPLLPRIKDP